MLDRDNHRVTPVKAPPHVVGGPLHGPVVFQVGQDGELVAIGVQVQQGLQVAAMPVPEQALDLFQPRLVSWKLERVRDYRCFSASFFFDSSSQVRSRARDSVDQPWHGPIVFTEAGVVEVVVAAVPELGAVPSLDDIERDDVFREDRKIARPERIPETFNML